jgi:hypothetical protein
MKVDYYGQHMPLKQLANVGVPDAKTIEIRPWDKNAIQPIEKAISVSDLRLTPQRQGDTIRLVIPPLTQERRLELIKLAKKVGRGQGCHPQRAPGNQQQAEGGQGRQGHFRGRAEAVHGRGPEIHRYHDRQTR